MIDWASDKSRVRLERVFKAPAAEVFRAFTDPNELKTWAWAGMGEPAEHEVDLRIGGRYRMYIKVKDRQGWHSDKWGMLGVYADIVPEKRLVYSLHWDAPMGYNQGGAMVLDEIVIVEFAPAPGGTLVTFNHLGVPEDGISAREHARGEAQMFELLAKRLERL